MATFRKLCENLGRDFWDEKKDGHEEKKSMDLILRGLEVRPDRTDGNTFWDDFLAVIGSNSDAASALLGVSSDVIAGWPQKIRKGIEAVRKDNDQADKKSNMINTGEKS